MNIWRLISFHVKQSRSQVTQLYIDNRRIAIGWGAVGDLSNYASSKAIGQAIKHHYPQLKNAQIGGPSLWNMFAEIEKGDLVIIDARKPWARVVEITGDYKWNDAQPNITQVSDYYHQREVRLRDDIRANDLLRTTTMKPESGQNQRLVLFRYGSSARSI